MGSQHQTNTQNLHLVLLVCLVALDPTHHHAPRVTACGTGHVMGFVKDHGMVFVKDHGKASLMDHAMVFLMDRG